VDVVPNAHVRTRRSSPWPSRQLEEPDPACGPGELENELLSSEMAAVERLPDQLPTKPRGEWAIQGNAQCEPDPQRRRGATTSFKFLEPGPADSDSIGKFLQRETATTSRLLQVATECGRRTPGFA